MKNLSLFKKLSRALTAITVLALFALLVATPVASAHGRRDLADGKYQIVVGFLSEPAFTGAQNGIDLMVCQGKCENNPDGTLKNPVKDVQKTLKAQAIYGSQTL